MLKVAVGPFYLNIAKGGQESGDSAENSNIYGQDCLYFKNSGLKEFFDLKLF